MAKETKSKHKKKFHPDMTEIEQLQNECNEYKAGWQRAQADYQNLQKEIQTKKSEWIKMSEFHVLEEFIPVYDNFKKAFASQPEAVDKSWENWSKGIGFIKKQFQDILTAHGVEEIETVGQPFDIERHEALSEEASDDYAEDTIIREIETGYVLDGRVVKAAKVVVAKAPEKKS